MSDTNISQWVEASIAEDPRIWCEDPSEQVDAGGNTYLAYRLIYKQLGQELLSVRRRYREFEALRSRLTKRFVPLGIMVPVLPPKHGLSQWLSAKVEKDFVRERTLGLNFFCDCIISNPFLRYDSTWKEFMDSKVDLVSNNDLSEDGEGLENLKKCLKNLSVPFHEAMEERIFNLKEEITALESHTNGLLEKSKAYVATLETLQDSESEVLDALHLSVVMESQQISTLKPNDYVTNEESSLSTFNAIKKNFTHRNPERANHFSLTIVTSLQQIILLCDSLKELIAHHEIILKSLNASKLKFKNLKAKHNLLDIDLHTDLSLHPALSGASSYAPSAPTLSQRMGFANSETKLKNGLEQLQLLQVLILKEEQQLRDFYKGFCYFSLPYIIRVRSALMRKATCNFVSSQLASSYETHIGAQNFFYYPPSTIENPATENNNKIGINFPSQKAAVETNRFFDLAKLEHLATLPVSSILPAEPESVSTKKSTSNRKKIIKSKRIDVIINDKGEEEEVEVEDEIEVEIPDFTEEDEELLANLNKTTLTTQPVSIDYYLTEETRSFAGLINRSELISKGEPSPQF